MHHTRTNPIAKTAMLLAATGVAAIAILWSWNTLAELAGGPTAQFKHVVAAAILIATVRYVLSRRPSRHNNHHKTDGGSE